MTPDRYLIILREELLKVPGKVSAPLAAETNPAMVAAMMKQAFSQAYRRAMTRYRSERKKARTPSAHSTSTRPLTH
jgi:hypothetical protein